MISSNTPDSGVAAGPGCGAQRASLHCVRCGHQRGWLSNEIAKFLSDVIEHFGRPIAPVRVRMPQTTPELRPADRGEAPTIPHICVEEPPDKCRHINRGKDHEKSCNSTS